MEKQNEYEIINLKKQIKEEKIVGAITTSLLCLLTGVVNGLGIKEFIKANYGLGIIYSLGTICLFLNSLTNACYFSQKININEEKLMELKK